MAGPIGLSMQETYLVFCRKIIVVLTFKRTCFQNKQWTNALCHFLSFCSVVAYGQPRQVASSF